MTMIPLLSTGSTLISQQRVGCFAIVCLMISFTDAFRRAGSGRSQFAMRCSCNVDLGRADNGCSLGKILQLLASVAETEGGARDARLHRKKKSFPNSIR